MQVAPQATPDKQAALERQAPSAETTSFSKTKAPNTGVDGAVANGIENNQTSQYLKVLSRIESLSAQDKLPDAAIMGFVGAVKKQLAVLGETERQMLLKLPEMKALALEKLEQLPEIIKDDLTNESKAPALLKLLRQPQFAALMRTDAKPAPQTYSAPTTTTSQAAAETPTETSGKPDHVSATPPATVAPQTAPQSAKNLTAQSKTS